MAKLSSLMSRPSQAFIAVAFQRSYGAHSSPCLWSNRQCSGTRRASDWNAPTEIWKIPLCVQYSTERTTVLRSSFVASFVATSALSVKYGPNAIWKSIVMYNIQRKEFNHFFFSFDSAFALQACHNQILALTKASVRRDVMRVVFVALALVKAAPVGDGDFLARLHHVSHLTIGEFLQHTKHKT